MKTFKSAMSLLVAMAIAFTMVSCNMSGNKKTNETSDSTKVSDTTKSNQGTTVDTNKRSQNLNNNQSSERTDAPRMAQQNAKTGQAWDVPAAEKNKKNPVKSSAESIKSGKDLWAKHCASCHGRSGAGDGPKSATLKTKIMDFKSQQFQSQTDGEIAYKTNVGKGEMPAYSKKLQGNDVWDLVNYMRSLK
jgi:mono/diheme cytochrome c family protein